MPKFAKSQVRSLLLITNKSDIYTFSFWIDFISAPYDILARNKIENPKKI